MFIIAITVLWEVLGGSLYPQVLAEGLTPPSFPKTLHVSTNRLLRLSKTSWINMNFLVVAPASGRTVGWFSWGILTEKAWTLKKEFLHSPRHQGDHGVHQDSPGILPGDFTANIPHLFRSGKLYSRSSYSKLLFRWSLRWLGGLFLSHMGWI